MRAPPRSSADADFMARLEKVRIEAGLRMGIPDAAERVIPKPIIIAPPAQGGTLAARYFMPHQCHGAFALTGSVAMATALVTPKTVAADLVGHQRPRRTSASNTLRAKWTSVWNGTPTIRSPQPLWFARTPIFEGQVLTKRSALEPKA